MKKYAYTKVSPMSIDKLARFCRQLEGKSLKESVAIGLGRGLSRHNIESLRQILGYCGSGNKHKFSPEQRDMIAKEYSETETTMQELARKYGVRYNSIRCILIARDITIKHPKEWSIRQEKFLEFEYNRGNSIRKIAAAMGKSRNAITQKIERMVKAGKLKKREYRKAA